MRGSILFAVVSVLFLQIWLPAIADDTLTEASLRDDREDYPLDTEDDCEEYREHFSPQFGAMIATIMRNMRDQLLQRSVMLPQELLESRGHTWDDLEKILVFQEDLELCARNFYQDDRAKKASLLRGAEKVKHDTNRIRSWLVGWSLMIPPEKFAEEFEEWIYQNLKSLPAPEEMTSESWLQVAKLYQDSYVLREIKNAERAFLHEERPHVFGRPDHSLAKATERLNVARLRREWMFDLIEDMTAQALALKKDIMDSGDVIKEDLSNERRPQDKGAIEPAQPSPNSEVIAPAPVLGRVTTPSGGSSKQSKVCSAKGCWKGLRKLFGFTVTD